MHAMLLHALRMKDQHAAMTVLQSSVGPQVLDYDQCHGNELLYWIIAGEVADTICPMLCQSDDPNVTFPIKASDTPLCKVFTLYGSTTFQAPGGGPLATLNVPAISLAVLHQAFECVVQILIHGGDVNAKIPETGQTPMHIVALCQDPAVPADFFSGQGNGLPPWFMQQRVWASEEARKNWIDHIEHRITTLGSRGADLRAKDNLGRCPITSAIAGGQMYVASTMIAVFAMNDRMGEMDFEAYVMEIIRMTRPEHGGTLPNAKGLRDVLDKISIFFMDDPSDKKLAKTKDLPLRENAARQSMMARRFVSSAGEPQLAPKGARRVAAGAKNSLGSCVARLVVAAMEAAAWGVLEWLISQMHAQHMCILARGVPIAVLAIDIERPEIIKQLVLDCSVDMTAKNRDGESAMLAACMRRKTAFLTNFCRLAPRMLFSRELRERHPSTGLTPLGHAVANGYASETLILLQACRRAEIPFTSLLEREAAEVLHPHKPLFSALIGGHSPIIRILLNSGLEPHSWPCVEHIQVASGRVCPSTVEDIADNAEMVTLVMCAASVGSSSVLEMLLDAGASAIARPPGNTKFPNAISMAMNWDGATHHDGVSLFGDSSPLLPIESVEASSTTAAAHEGPGRITRAGGAGSEGVAGEKEVPSLGRLTLQDTTTRAGPVLLERLKSVKHSSAHNDALSAPHRRKATGNPIPHPSFSGALEPLPADDRAGANAVSPDTKEIADELRLWQNRQRRAHVVKLLEGKRCPKELQDVEISTMVMCQCCGEEDKMEDGDDYHIDENAEMAWLYDRSRERMLRRKKLEIFSSAPTGGGACMEDQGEMQHPWSGEGLGRRLRCIQLLLERGAGVSKRQAETLTSNLENCDKQLEEGKALAKLVGKKLKPCSGCQAFGLWKACICREAWYCGVVCQKDQWSTHKKQCKKNKKAKK